MSSRQGRIEAKIKSALAPKYMELLNESHMHSVPENSETHFRLIVVSDKFEGLSRVARTRLINDALADEFKSGLHALAQRSYSPEEWAEMNEQVDAASPPCFGGSKREKA